MNFAKKLADKFENLMIAVTFAEAGEFETARKSMQEEKGPKKRRSKPYSKTLRAVSAQ